MNERPDTLLTLIVPAALAETMADLLLDAPDIVGGFTSSPASGHGATLEFMRGNERVRGRERRVKFEIALDSASLPGLRERVLAELPDVRLYYWTTALRSCGVLP